MQQEGTTPRYEITDLQSLAEASALVPVGNGKAIMVYGLPFDQMMALFSGYLTYLDEILDPAGNFVKTSDLVARMLMEAPELVARTICLACRYETSEKNLQWAANCVAGVQTAIVIEALQLTFPDGELLGKFWAQVEKLVGMFSSQLALKLTVAASMGEQKATPTS